MEWFKEGVQFPLPPLNFKTPTSMNLVDEIVEFQEYCMAFYNNETGVYPIATNDEIVRAVDQYLRSTPLSEVEFDSLDRERVREIIQPSYSII